MKYIDTHPEYLVNSRPYSHLDFDIRPSPTFSTESRKKWASRLVGRLAAFHREVGIEPDFAMTIKFNKPATIEQIKQYHFKRLTAVRYFRKAHESLSGIWCIEINKQNICHEHLLIRTSLSLEATKNWFSRHCDKVNRQLGTSLTVDWIESIHEVEKASRYLFKCGQEPVMFKRRLGLRQFGKFGSYFGDMTAKEQKVTAQAEYLEKIREAKLEQIFNGSPTPRRQSELMDDFNPDAADSV